MPKSRARATRPLIQLTTCSVILDDRPVLDEVSFTLRASERWAIVGPNGAGKTLLLKMLRGDIWPTPTGRERRVYALGRGTQRNAVDVKRQIAYVGPERQDKYVRYGWNLSVGEVVATGLFDEDIPLTRPNAAQRARVDRMMKRFGIWKLRTRRILTLSYGQRRLALLARALVSDAQVLLLDEVFNGLDARARKQLKRALEQGARGMTWVLSSHRVQDLPSSVTHVAVLEAGRVMQAGPQSEMLDQVHHRLRPARARVRLTSSEVPMRRRRVATARWLIRIRNADLYREYRPILRGLDWTIRAGEHWAVLGANGAGKSTLLSLIHGDLHPALGGTIQRRGCPAGTPIANWKRRVGWVSPELQADHYLVHSLEEIVISGRYSSVGLNDTPTAADRRAAKRWMQFFGIAELAHRGPRQVSYGQMRLALLARAMINEPELLLLDEPCTGLARDVRAFVLQLLERLAEHGTQIVMAIHDPDDLIPAVRHILQIGRAGRVTIEELMAPGG